MKPFLTAISFLTIIKISQREFDFKNAPYFFPFIGFLIGLPVYFMLQSNIFLKELLSIAYLIVITGAFHLDGLSDTCDGIFSHRDRTKKLEIMKDSRIGTMGSIALILIILGKYELFKVTPPSLILVSLFFSRFIGILFMSKLPYARSDGLGKHFENFLLTAKNRNFIYFFISFIIIFFFLPMHSLLIILLVSMISSYIFKKVFLKILGGYTGDTVGAVIEISELMILYTLTSAP